jgi:HNH endonuclease
VAANALLGLRTPHPNGPTHRKVLEAPMTAQDRRTVTRDWAERFWSKVDKSAGDDGCWAWLGAFDAYGYSRYYRLSDRHPTAGHRVAYELAVGPIPVGLTIDHLCRNTGCVNPAHMEPVTCRENVLRGTGPSALAAKREACVNGHAFDDLNTRREPDRYGSRRTCRVCGRIKSKRWRDRQKEAAHV